MVGDTSIDRSVGSDVRRRFRGLRLLRRVSRDESGVTAVEFGMLAMPFFLLIVAIMETSLIFLGELTLHQGVASVSRDVRVGTIRAGQGDLFQSRLCDRVSYLLTCSKLKYDVRTYASFANIPASTAGNNGTLDSSQFAFAPGGADSIDVVRVYYEWPIVTAYFMKSLSSLTNGNYLLASTTAFRTERY